MGLGTPRKAGGSRWKRKESEVGPRENQDFWGDGSAKNWELRDAPFLASFKLGIWFAMRVGPGVGKGIRGEAQTVCRGWVCVRGKWCESLGACVPWSGPGYHCCRWRRT